MGRATSWLLLGIALMASSAWIGEARAQTAAGLVASYGFEEGAGTSVSDASGNGNVGTMSGARWDPAGRFGGALYFGGGVNGVVTIPDAPNLDLTTGMTLEAWVKPKALGGWRTVILKEAAGDLAYGLYANSNTGVPAGYITTTGWQSARGPAPLPAFEWSHLAASYDGVTLRLYVNGAEVATRSAPGAIPSSNRPLKIGGNTVWGEFFRGWIDEVRVYDRPLSPSEILADMSQGSAMAPRLVIDAPAAGEQVVGSTLDIAYSTTGDLAQVSHLHFRLDGGADLMDLELTDGVFQITGLAPGPHTLDGYLVRTGHEKVAGSDALTVSFTVVAQDLQPPTVTLTAPNQGDSVTGVVALTASAADDVGVESVQFMLDGAPLGAPDTVPPYAMSWDTAAAGLGPHVLTALARDGAGRETTSAPVGVVVVGANDPSIVGSWSAPIPLPTVAVNLILLHTGKVLFWAGEFQTAPNFGELWDPATNDVTPVPNPFSNIFCSAHVALADGRLLVAGGHDQQNNILGLPTSNIFDPVTERWQDLPDMAYRRWYPTMTLMGDGRAIINSGSEFSETVFVDTPEIFDPVSETWTEFVEAPATFPQYPMMFLLPDGRLLQTGSTESPTDTRVLDFQTNTWSVVDPRVLDGGSAVMYRPGEIMKAGSPSLDGATPLDPSLAVTYVLDMNAATPVWRETQPMAYPRTFHNIVMLPDGTALATGGSQLRSESNLNPAVLAAELWDPDTETWSTLSSMQFPRLYHGTAVLLPDARVAVAGGGNLFGAVDMLSVEIFSPPYLFKGPRPSIGAVPADIDYAAEFVVQTPDAASVGSVVLVRPGAATHGFDQEQRYVPLGFTQDGAGALRVDAPSDSNLAPPGYYMLFLLSDTGVPSVAEFVRLPAPYEDAVPPSQVQGLSAVGGVGSVTLGWLAATDDAGPVTYEIHRSISPGFTPSDSTRIATTASTTYVDLGAAAGTWSYRVRAVDLAGNAGLASGAATAVVEADVTSPTISITSPAAGTTLTGSAVAQAAASDDVGVAGVQFLLDGAPLGPEDAVAPYTVQWNTATVGNGTHTLSARARDGAGNTTTSAGVSIEVVNAQVPGLVAAWSFEEGAGATALDTTGNGHDGLVSGALWTSNGRQGRALSFDGVNDLVTVADSNQLDLGSTLTLEAWVAPDSLQSWRTVLMKTIPGDISYGLYASGLSAEPIAYLRSAATSSIAAPSALPLAEWSHLAVSYDGQTIRLYVNGVEVGTRAFSGALTASTMPLSIGGNSIWGEHFQGRIDEVRIYDRALSASEIQADMNAAANPIGPQVTITAPADGALVAGSTVDVQYSVGGDLTEVSHVHFRLDGGPEIEDPPPIDGVLQLTGLAPGAHVIDAWAVRSDHSAVAGSDAQTIAFTTTLPDASPPAVVIVAPRDGNVLSGVAQVSVNAFDDIGVVGVQLALDGTPVGPEMTTEPFDQAWNTLTVANGTYLMTATARDAAGNTATSIAIRVTIANADVIPGLVAAYGFDEGAGVTASDSSGQSNDGGVVGATWSPDGRFGSALSFSGAGDVVVVPDSNSLDVVDGLTLEAWVRPTAFSGWQTVLMKEMAGDLVWSLYSYDNAPRSAGYLRTGPVTTVSTPAPLPLDAWSHLAMTYDGARIRLYQNGAEIASAAAAGAIATSTGDLRIGGNSIWGEFFAGLIDEVRVYDRALDAAEIQADMDRPVVPVVPSMPTQSSPIVLDGATRRVWVVNPDNDSVASLDADTLLSDLEVPVGAHPMSLAIDAAGRVWVACQDDDTLWVVDGSNGSIIDVVDLPRGSAPVAVVFGPDGNDGFVSAHGTGRVHRFDASAGTLGAALDVGPTPRALAVTSDGQRLLVSRFISGDAGGSVYVVDLGSFALDPTIDLPIDTTSIDSSVAARGLPNYLVGLAIDPGDGKAWVVAKKDNILRGLFRDGQPLTFETSVRAMVGQLDLLADVELSDQRFDIDNHAQPAFVALSRSGQHVFLAMQGNNDLIVLNPLGGEIVRASTGLAPQGVLIDPVTRRVFTKNLMSRDVTVFDGAALIDTGASSLPVVATVPTVASEAMAPDVLLGKQIFYNAADPRMGADGYISCALCHLDGGHDGRVWDFTDRGEGLRNTISLRGQGGDAGAPLHWSANFDEVQDFEHDIRGPFGGDGFMADADFLAGTRSDPLGDPKAGVTAELDALAAYVNSLQDSGRSPDRQPDGAMTPEALAGQAIFSSLGCGGCHVGPRFSDSPTGLRHDVGTIKPSSGQRIGGPLDGLDTPMLIELWESAPYLHDGSAATLQDVLTTQNAGGLHGDLSGLAPADLDRLVQYLRQLELNTP